MGEIAKASAPEITSMRKGLEDYERNSEAKAPRQTKLVRDVGIAIVHVVSSFAKYALHTCMRIR